MTNKPRKGKPMSRRGLLPLLGSSLLIPFLGLGNPLNDDMVCEKSDEDYKIMLKPDGTTVKVKIKTIKKSKVIKKGMSNKSLLNWLNKK